MVVAIEMPSSVAVGAECALWFGLVSGASAEMIAEAEAMGRQVTEWFSWYGAVIEANKRVSLERQQEKVRISEMVSLLHDARAPLGVLKYLAREGAHGDDSVLLQREIAYLERLLMQGAPRATATVHAACDVGEVVGRVYRRYVHEFGAEKLRVEQGYAPVFVQVVDLDVERLLTNLVSNAHRHAPGSSTVISVEDRGAEVVLSVRDNGPGISDDILEAMESGSATSHHATSGWGVGLQSCVMKVRSLGGDLTIASRQGVGTKVTITFPAAPPPVRRQVMEVFDGGVTQPAVASAVDIFVVDDDKEHSASLARLLRRAGFVVQESGTVEEFLGIFAACADAVILCDAHMPGGGAERLLPILSSRKQMPRFAVVSGDATDEYLYKLAALGAQAFFAKPIAVDEILGWIRMPLTAEREASGAGIHRWS
jgi:CheY-like chemotaxis protein/anti-sigma regulatory factor (Ser/Thr protein kinase)